MAQLGVFQREIDTAKKVRGSLPQKTEEPKPKPAAPKSETSEPSLLDRATSYAADKLSPQKDKIETKPPRAGSKWMPDLSEQPWAKLVARNR